MAAKVAAPVRNYWQTRSTRIRCTEIASSGQIGRVRRMQGRGPDHGATAR